MPGRVLARTAAVVLPPSRGCRTRARPVNTTGAREAAPAAAGPAARPTRRAPPTATITAAARTGTSHHRPAAGPVGSARRYGRTRAKATA
jgi:hypothetical protein